MKQNTGIAVGLALGLLAVSTTNAQEFPSRPITMVVPYTPGASTDIVMRTIGQKVFESTGQPFIVDNRGGGGGTAAAMAVKQASPDGYTLLFGHAGTHAINPALSKLAYDPEQDFGPITSLMSFSSVLVVPSASPARSVADLIALGKSRQEWLSYASQGNGSGGHLLGEMFRAETQSKTVHVPYRGGAPAITDTVASRVDFLFASYITAGPFIRDGRLRALAVTSFQRSGLLPDVPTMKEVGYPGVELDYWFGVFAPKATPDTVIQVLNREFRLAMQSPQVITAISGQGAEVLVGSPDDLGNLVKAERERLGLLIRDIGATAQ